MLVICSNPFAGVDFEIHRPPQMQRNSRELTRLSLPHTGPGKGITCYSFFPALSPSWPGRIPLSHEILFRDTTTPSLSCILE